MKYEYGVEYATGFNCPSLPGDVMVEARYSDGNWHRDGADRFDEFNWASFSHFRIVDERYKPKPEDNTWFERGELPPVGAMFEAYFERDNVPRWSAGIVAYKSTEHVILKFDDGDENYYESKELKKIGKFRPLKTEREKAIEAAKDALLKTGSLAITANLETLYDAGLLRLPEGK